MKTKRGGKKKKEKRDIVKGGELLSFLQASGGVSEVVNHSHLKVSSVMGALQSGIAHLIGMVSPTCA